MDMMDKKHAAKHTKDAKEMMSDAKFSHMQHEQSESPAYERMEEKAVKMMRSKMKPGSSY
jgi:hypothetical protein